jgi:hypothetical protein
MSRRIHTGGARRKAGRWRAAFFLFAAVWATTTAAAVWTGTLPTILRDLQWLIAVPANSVLYGRWCYWAGQRDLIDTVGRPVDGHERNVRTREGEGAR